MYWHEIIVSLVYQLTIPIKILLHELWWVPLVFRSSGAILSYSEGSLTKWSRGSGLSSRTDPTHRIQPVLIHIPSIITKATA
jgi:hypothetical protein